MSADVTRTVEDMVNEVEIDNSPTFDKLWSILGELKVKLDNRFEFTPDASTADLQPYESLDVSYKGFLSTFTAPEIDWLVYSYMGNPETGFCNMHLTINLGPQYKVPHFGMALGTIPEIFMYIDYIPRVDLFADPEYGEKYYEPVNETFLDYREDERFKPFTSRTLFMRQAQSATSLCFMVPIEDEVIEKIRLTAHGMLDRWIGYVDAADEIPMEERAANGARDLKMRREICERDPANVLGVQLYGEEMTNRLVRALWGGDRANPRVGGIE